MECAINNIFGDLMCVSDLVQIISIHLASILQPLKLSLLGFIL